MSEKDYDNATEEQRQAYQAVFKEEIDAFGEIYDTNIDVNTWCPECEDYDIFMNSGGIDIEITCFSCFIKEVVA